MTVANTISPDPAAGSLLRRPLIPFTAIIYRFLPPVLSAQFITAPTGRPREIRNFPPEEPPRPRVRNYLCSLIIPNDFIKVDFLEDSQHIWPMC